MKVIVVAVVVSLVAASCGQAPPAAEPGAATAPAQAPVVFPPKYAANVPASVTTPDTVQTRIGTLKFSDGLPDADGAMPKAASRRIRASAFPRTWRTPVPCS